MVDKTPAELDPGITSDTSVIHASENNVSTNSKGHNERDISRLQGVAQIYSSSKLYNVNDMVTESDVVYRCINAIVVPEVFNIVNWSEINAEDTLIFVRNVSGSMISKGSAVYITGADSGDVTIDLADASSISTVAAIGITQDNISNNNTGDVVRIGHINDLNTSAFSAGDTLYLSATTPGGLTSTSPTHPNIIQKLAIVLVSDLTLGEIEVLTGELSGAESGTISNSFVIGDGLAGTKTLSFLNDAGTFSANALFTAPRAQSFQDADGTLALTSDIIDTTASNVGTGDGWFKQKTGIDLEFKSVIEGFGLVVNNNTDDITLEVNDEEIVQRFREKRQIFIVPSDDANFLFGGLGAGTFTQEGTSTGTLDADGFYITFEATGGMGAEPGGIFITDSVRRDLNFNIETKFRLNDLVNADFILGFFELDPIANGFDNNEHIALIRDADGANTNFLLSHCDGVGAATQTQIAVADTNIHTFLVIADDANSKFQTSFDGAALTDVTTNIPDSTTNLILFGEVIDGGGGGSLDAAFWYLEGFADA